MTSKERAKYLVELFMEIVNYETAKKCAIIYVDETDRRIIDRTPKADLYANLLALEYWQEVKEEIQKL